MTSTTHLQPELRSIPEKKLVGQHLRMSLVNNRTGELWRSFMPRRREIPALYNEMVSLQIYEPGYFVNFDPTREFEKWALVEVAGLEAVPEGMDTFLLPAGLYAVFHYKGSSQDTAIFEHIFRKWLPTSGYTLDDRPHFEVLGEKYKNNDPDSEEEIWIPVRRL